MKLMNILLTILLGMTIFMVSCDGSTEESDNSCSSTNLDGDCEAGKYCDAGVCVLQTAVCDPACTDEQACIEGTCTDKTKEVDCVDNAPANATSTLEKVTITYDENLSKWEEVAECAWECSAGFEKNLVGTACVDIVVDCTTDADCTDAALPVCEAGVCVADVTPDCTTDADCTDAALPVCEAGVCVADVTPDCTDRKSVV